MLPFRHVRVNILGDVRWKGVRFLYTVFIAETVIQDNPYKGYFKEAQLQKLIPYLALGQTPDADEIGLASKFELEACNEHLMFYGLVLLRVS